jgi:hypothetical protein
MSTNKAVFQRTFCKVVRTCRSCTSGPKVAAHPRRTTMRQIPLAQMMDMLAEGNVDIPAVARAVSSSSVRHKLVQHTSQGPCVTYKQCKSYFTESAIRQKPEQPYSRACRDPALQPGCHPGGRAAVVDALERLKLVNKAHCDAYFYEVHDARSSHAVQAARRVRLNIPHRSSDA